MEDLKVWAFRNIEWVLTVIILPIVAWFVKGKRRNKIELDEKNASVSAISTDVLLKNFDLHLRMVEDIENRHQSELNKRDIIIEQQDKKIDKLEKKIQDLEEILEKHINNN